MHRASWLARERNATGSVPSAFADAANVTTSVPRFPAVECQTMMSRDKVKRTHHSGRRWTSQQHAGRHTVNLPHGGRRSGREQNTQRERTTDGRRKKPNKRTNVKILPTTTTTTTATTTTTMTTTTNRPQVSKQASKQQQRQRRQTMTTKTTMTMTMTDSECVGVGE